MCSWVWEIISCFKNCATKMLRLCLALKTLDRPEESWRVFLVLLIEADRVSSSVVGYPDLQDKFSLFRWDQSTTYNSQLLAGEKKTFISKGFHLAATKIQSQIWHPELRVLFSVCSLAKSKVSNEMWQCIESCVQPILLLLGVYMNLHKDTYSQQTDKQTTYVGYVG